MKDSFYSLTLQKAKLGEANDGTKEVTEESFFHEVMAHEVREFSMAFENGFHFGCFYAYIQLRL